MYVEIVSDHDISQSDEALRSNMEVLIHKKKLGPKSTSLQANELEYLDKIERK